jgi:AcrR family transcriptional regulator
MSTQSVAPVTGRAVRRGRKPFRRVLLDGQPSKRTQRSLATSERILDAAEELFARHGIYGVTTREIAELADVDTALLHYYFESKRGVFDSVFARRSDVLIVERMQELDRYEAEAGDRPMVEGIIAAYLRPMFALNREGGRGWCNFCAFVAHLDSTELADVFTKKFEPVIKRLIALLQRALPDAEEADLYWSFHMFSGALMIVNAANGSIEGLSDGLCQSVDFDAIEPRLVRYSSQGFRALCEKKVAQ